MGTDIHLYANGNDPFTFPLGEYIVHVHAGAPPGEAIPVVKPSPARVTPRVIAYPTKTPVRAPIELAYADGADAIRGWLSTADAEPGEQPIRFRVDALSGSSRPEIRTLLEGIQDLEGRSVNVDIVGWSQSQDG